MAVVALGVNGYVMNFSVPVSDESAPEHALRPGFLATFGLATDQAGKLGLSNNKSIVCMYSSFQVGTAQAERRLHL